MKNTVKEQIRMFLLLLILCGFVACKKTGSAPDQTGNSGNGGNTNQGTDSVYNPVDPPVSPTIGFFGNAWKPRSFTVPNIQSGVVATQSSTDSLTIM